MTYLERGITITLKGQFLHLEPIESLGQWFPHSEAIEFAPKASHQWHLPLQAEESALTSKTPVSCIMLQDIIPADH